MNKFMNKPQYAHSKLTKQIYRNMKIKYFIV